jgi:hypothetical protein
MQLAIAIVTALVTLAGLAYKWWSAKRSADSMKADLAKETIRADAALALLEKARVAEKERGSYVKSLEAAMADHLKSCSTPLAGWANSLRGPGKGSGEAS